MGDSPSPVGQFLNFCQIYTGDTSDSGNTTDIIKHTETFSCSVLQKVAAIASERSHITRR